jgi:hypothetical protein
MGLSSLESPKNAAVAKELGFKVPPKAPTLTPNLKPVNPNQPPPNYGGSSGSGLAEVALAGAKAVGLKLALDKQAGSDPITPEGSGGGQTEPPGEPETTTSDQLYRVQFTTTGVIRKTTNGDEYPVSKTAHKDLWGPIGAPVKEGISFGSKPTEYQWYTRQAEGIQQWFNVAGWPWTWRGGTPGDDLEHDYTVEWSVLPYPDNDPNNVPGLPTINPKPSPDPKITVLPVLPTNPTSPEGIPTPTPVPTPSSDPNSDPSSDPTPNPEDDAFPSPETSTPTDPATGQPTSELGTPAQLEEAPSPVTPGALEKAPPVPEVPTSDLVPPVTTTKPPCQPANSCESSMISTMQEIKDTLEDLLDLLPAPVDCSPDAAVVATDACTEGELLEGTTIVDVPKGTASGWLWVSDRLKHITKLICEMPEPVLGVSEHFHLKPGTGRSALLINYKEHDGWTWQRSTFTITVPHPSSSTVSSFETLQPPARSIGGHYVTLTLLDGSRLRATGDTIENAKAFMAYLVSLIDTQWIPLNWDLNLTESFSNKIATREVFPRKLEYFPEGQTSSSAPKYERYLPKI